LREAGARATVALTPSEASRLWTDLRRWPSFVQGFARVKEVSPEWPEVGAKLVWESTPAGRGRVTEKVVESEAERFATEVYDESLNGTQAATFEAGEEGTRVEVRLAYELSQSGPARALADWLFIRRALRDSLRRTLQRFAVEAEEEAGLRFPN
jgi:Polyketide cyclase / dehydrase and lipid transport